MKKITPNLIVKLLNNFISIEKSLPSTIRKAVFLFVFTLFSSVIFAQNGNSTTPVVSELDLYINTLKVNDFNKSKIVESLIFDLQPAIYFYSGEVKTYGEKPNTLYTDINSIPDINNTEILKENIEIVNLRISSLNEKIDLSKFSNYNNLKYIYVVSKINLTDQNIINMIYNYDKKYTIFYKTLKEE